MAVLWTVLPWASLPIRNTPTSKRPTQANPSTRPTSLGQEVSSDGVFYVYLLDYLFNTAKVAAEYLARGYTLSDGILQRAIEIDSKQYDGPFYDLTNHWMGICRQKRNFKALPQLLQSI